MEFVCFINCEEERFGWLDVVPSINSLGDVLFHVSRFYEVYGIATQPNNNFVWVEVKRYVENEWAQLSLFGEE